MGTYALLTALWRHWKRPIHPVYQIETRYGPPWRVFDGVIARYGSGLTNVALGVVALTLLTTIGRILTGLPVLWLISNALLQMIGLLVGSFVTIALLGLVFLWPMAVAVASSGSIVRDREQRTWAALLTTPISWGDLLAIKLASALRWFNRPSQLLLWLHSLLLLVTLIVVGGQLERLSNYSSPLLAVLITALAGAQFVVGRIQDYTTACLIGLIASMQSETRQSASVYALLGSLGLVIGRVLWTGVLLTLYPIPSPQAALLLLATGPTTIVVLTSALPVMLLFLIGVPLLREAIIRIGYRWAVAHLGMVTGSG